MERMQGPQRYCYHGAGHVRINSDSRLCVPTSRRICKRNYWCFISNPHTLKRNIHQRGMATWPHPHPSRKVKKNAKQLQTANLVYTYLMLSVTARKCGMMTKEKQYHFTMKIYPREASKNISPKEKSFLHPTEYCDPSIYPYLVLLLNSQTIEKLLRS